MSTNDMNIVTIVGRLTRDAELKSVGSGTALSTFSIAVNRHYRDQEEASFFDVRFWGDYATKLSPYLEKGKQVIVTGEIIQQRWEKDGSSRSKIIISARIIQLIGSDGKSTYSPEGSKPSQNQSPVKSGVTQPTANEKPSQQAFPGPEMFDDDSDSIPF